MGRTDDIYKAAGLADPFLDETNPYLVALIGLPPKERKVIVRQVTLLCLATDLDPEGGLELLARLGVWLNEQRAALLQEDYDLRKFKEVAGGRKKT